MKVAYSTNQQHLLLNSLTVGREPARIYPLTELWWLLISF